MSALHPSIHIFHIPCLTRKIIQKKPHSRIIHAVHAHPSRSDLLEPVSAPRPRLVFPRRPPARQHPAPARDHRLRRRGAQPGHLYARVRGAGAARQPGPQGQEGGLCGVPGRAGAGDEERDARVSSRGGSRGRGDGRDRDAGGGGGEVVSRDGSEENLQIIRAF